jgi:hypothetical protein
VWNGAYDCPVPQLELNRHPQDRGHRALVTAITTTGRGKALTSYGVGVGTIFAFTALASPSLRFRWCWTSQQHP